MARQSKRSPKSLLTIGYEGATVEDFIATLRSAEVEVIIDIRECPISRKRGFSKRALSEALQQAGVAYVHLRQLGDPKPGRDAARRGDKARFESIFRAHMTGSDAQGALQRALEISAGARSCLLCFERDPAGCHRTMVAEEMLAQNRGRVFHLSVGKNA